MEGGVEEGSVFEEALENRVIGAAAGLPAVADVEGGNAGVLAERGVVGARAEGIEPDQLPLAELLPLLGVMGVDGRACVKALQHGDLPLRLGHAAHPLRAE